MTEKQKRERKNIERRKERELERKKERKIERKKERKKKNCTRDLYVGWGLKISIINPFKILLLSAHTHTFLHFSTTLYLVLSTTFFYLYKLFCLFTSFMSFFCLLVLYSLLFCIRKKSLKHLSIHPSPPPIQDYFTRIKL